MSALSYATESNPSALPSAPRIRLWPAILIVLAMWGAILSANHFMPATMGQFMIAFWGPIGCTVLMLVWWVFFSRAPKRDRWLLPVTLIGTMAVVWPLSDQTIGMFGIMLYGLRAALLVWVVALLVTSSAAWPTRRRLTLSLIVLVLVSLTLLRNEGVNGAFAASFKFRWQPTAEDEFLAQMKSTSGPATAPTTVPTLSTGDWPAFRGANRDGRLVGVRIDADWNARPPKQLWRHRIGPGWSSFSVVGDRLFTQEQRGADEAVVCYHADTGVQLWAHLDAARFTETVAGAGPRGTPTFDNGRIYALGATGLLNCLDAVSGNKIWSRNAAADTGAATPMWGFSASPLIARGLVTVYTGGKDGKAVIAYRIDTGEIAWTAGQGQFGYSSTQLATLAGVEQILLASDDGLSAFDPASGAVLWRHEWAMKNGMVRIVQPAVLPDGDILLGTGMDYGTRRLHVTHAGKDWAITPVYTTRTIKPYFNDFVVHGGFIYGIEGVFLTCVDAADGKLKWRTRGYGSGQVLLLADQSLLLVLAETGEAALVDAAPDAYRERGRFQALEGKTWNHPVIARGKLFVRNGEEIAAYSLQGP